ncbi:MAG: CorA family divalent cation transporter [Burkholderiales bacterium]
MLHAFSVKDARLHPVEAEASRLRQSRDLVWLDVVAPSADELRAVEAAYRVEIGSLEQGQNIEASARFFGSENGDLHLRNEFLSEPGETTDSAPVHFVLTTETLISVHAVELPTLKLVRDSATTNPGNIADPKDVLLEIYATDAEYCADALESVHRHLKGASRNVLTRQVTDKLAAAVLARVAQQEDLNGNVRQNISDTRRALSFLTRERVLTDEQAAVARQIGHDLDSLDAHTAFLFDKINFLMDATVGFLNVTQNKVIKTFSVAAVAMLPPTLIASIYGMNFQHMPELSWMLGYPFALGLMALSVLVPFLWFRQRGWLK